MLNLRLFGRGDADYYERRLDGFPCHQEFLLLCYLLINKRQPLFREKLASVFWGNYSNVTARKCLRNALYRLRQQLEAVGADSGQYLWVTEESVEFIDNSPHWVDVETFDSITSRYQSCRVENLLPEQVAELKKGVELYTGDLLERVYQDWCLYERERLRLSYLEALNKLMLYSTLHQEYDQGLAYGANILSLDPTREEVHRQMMLLYWLKRDPYAALAQYKRCVKILKDEIGVQPVWDTQILYDRMVNNEFEPFLDHQGREFSLSDFSAAKGNQKDLELLQRYLEKLQDKVSQISRDIEQVQKLVYQIHEVHPQD